MPDQIGFGDSDKPSINYRVSTLVDFLDGFCKKLGIAKASIVGNSLGGWTAMAFTLAHPDKVEEMVLVDSAGYSFDRLGGPKSTREMLETLNPSTVAATKTVIALIVAKTIERFIDSIFRREDVVDGMLGAIKVPTMIIW